MAYREEDTDSLIDSETPYDVSASFRYGSIQETYSTHSSKTDKKTSALQAYFTFVNAFVGAGILALPYGFRNAGILAGLAALIVLAIACNYTLKLLAVCKTQYRGPESIQSYTDLGRVCMGKWGVFIVNASIICSQIGFVCCYLIFIGDNLSSVIARHPFSPHVVVLSIVPILALLAWVRNLKYLAHTSIIGNVAVVIAVAVVLQFGFTNQRIHSLSEYSLYIQPNFPLFYGVVCFGFAVHSLALEVQGSMAKPAQFPLVVNLSMFFVTVVYLVFGILCYLFFKDNIQDEVTLNLNGIEGDVVKVSVSIVLLFAYPLQLFPVVKLVEASLFASSDKRSCGDTWKRNIFRLILVGVTVGLSIAVPFFGLLASFVGAFSNSFISFILPCTFYWILFRHTLRWWKKCIVIVILSLGITGMIVGTTISVTQIGKRLMHGHHH